MTLTTFDSQAADSFLRRLWAMDGALEAAGFHPMSEWWRASLERFVHALPRRVRRAIVRAGRRAGKSSTICRLLVAWALWGAWAVPRGDVAVIAFLSVSRDEASARLRTIAAILDVLGVAYEQADGEIEIATERGPVVFKVYAANNRSVGFTAIAVVGDEVARWESRDTAANPAAEVFASLFPTLASQPFGFALLVSSPWGSDDYHAQRFDEGDSDAQIVAYAPTWVANPTISEARTHELEPDARIWSREYAAVPGAVVSAAIDRTDIEACFGTTPPTVTRWWLPIDASSLRGDVFAWMLAGTTADGAVVVADVGGFDGEQLRRVSMRDVVSALGTRAKANGANVLGDQREEAALRSMFAEEGVTFSSYAWTEATKDRAVQLIRRLARERKLYLCYHAQLRSQLVGLKARLLPSGRSAYGTNGQDYVSALITFATAIDAGDVPLMADNCPIAHFPTHAELGSRWSDYGSSRGF